MIALERLLASALGELDASDDAEVEEHVVSCGECAERFAAFVRLGPAIVALVRAGGATLAATKSLVDRASAEGLVSRRYVLDPGAIVACAVGTSDIYSLVTFTADLRGVARLDLVRGATRIADVPFDPAAGCIYTLTSSAALRTLPTMKIPFRLIACEADGSERTIAEYTLDHTAA